MSSGVWFILLLLVLGATPIFLGAIVLLNRDAGDDRDEELEELKQRVDDLEAEQD